MDESKKLIAMAMKVGILYYLDCRTGCQQIHALQDQSRETKENVWHRRFGHLGTQNLKKLAKDKLVEGYNYDKSKVKKLTSVSRAPKESTIEVNSSRPVANRLRSHLNRCIVMYVER